MFSEEPRKSVGHNSSMSSNSQHQQDAEAVCPSHTVQYRNGLLLLPSPPWQQSIALPFNLTPYACYDPLRERPDSNLSAHPLDTAVFHNTHHSIPSNIQHCLRSWWPYVPFIFYWRNVLMYIPDLSKSAAISSWPRVKWHTLQLLLLDLTTVKALPTCHQDGAALCRRSMKLMDLPPNFHPPIRALRHRIRLLLLPCCGIHRIVRFTTLASGSLKSHARSYSAV